MLLFMSKIRQILVNLSPFSLFLSTLNCLFPHMMHTLVDSCCWLMERKITKKSLAIFFNPSSVEASKVITASDLGQTLRFSRTAVSQSASIMICMNPSKALTVSSEKQWKSSGYYVSFWVPETVGSLDVDNWYLKDYIVHVVTTSSKEFDQLADGCEDIC